MDSGEVMGVPRTKGCITITIDEELCKGCGLCVAVCPRESMVFAEWANTRGFHPACVPDPETCTGCAQCALMCPDACITITRSG